MKKIVLLFLLLTVLIPNVYSSDVSYSKQAKLMLKILSMDRNFSRFGDPIKIGVSSDDMLSELNKLEGKMKIKGKNFVAEKMSSVDDISKYKVTYIGKDWSSNYSAVSEKAKENSCITFCAEEDAVFNIYFAFAFLLIDNKTYIAFNEGVAIAQGSSFIPGFLKVLVVIGSLG